MTRKIRVFRKAASVIGAIGMALLVSGCIIVPPPYYHHHGYYSWR